jgi:hypothetical protein
MAKATLTLPGGTTVVIEGTPEEVNRMLELHAGGAPGAGTPTPKPKLAKRRAKKREPSGTDDATASKNAPDLSQIINLIKTSDEAEMIEERILDRTSLVDRTLLPLYIVHEQLGNAFGLTSGDVSRITTDLGIPIRTPHASTTLSSTAARYVIGDQVRRRGVPVRYRLSRRGVQYMKSVLSGGNEK